MDFIFNHTEISVLILLYILAAPAGIFWGQKNIESVTKIKKV